MNKKSALFGWLVCGLGALFYCYEYFLRVTPSVMTQELSQSFNISAAALGNLVAFYYYIYVPMQLPAGLLMDRYGPRRLLTVAALSCAIGSCLFAQGSIELAMIGRLLVGFGSAFAFVGTLRLAVSWLPASRFAFITGSVTTLGMLGAMGADILLSHMIQFMNWRNTIYLSAIAGVFITAMIWFLIPAKEPTLADTANHADQQNTVTFAQLFKEFAQLVKKPQLWLIGVVGCLFYMPISVFAELWGIPFLKQAYGLSNTVASSTISLIFLGEVIGGPITGWMADKLNNRILPIMLFSIIAAVLFAVLISLHSMPHALLGIVLFLIGFLCTGENLVFPIACRMADVRLAGTAMAMTNMLVMLGGLVFQPLLGVFLEMASGKHVKGDLSVYTGTDFKHALMMLPVFLVVTFIIMFFIKDKTNNGHQNVGSAAVGLREQSV